MWIKQKYSLWGIWDDEIAEYGFNPYLKTRRKVYRYFLEKSKVFQIFLDEEYQQNIPYVANDITDTFEKWFLRKRKMVMENSALEMAKHNEKIFKPTSHSGIASLLNVLTRTMEKQGADITSIAKVQYAVCVQAGVYIPDEFLLDVAIAMCIEDAKEGD